MDNQWMLQRVSSPIPKFVVWCIAKDDVAPFVACELYPSIRIHIIDHHYFFHLYCGPRQILLREMINVNQGFVTSLAFLLR